MLQTSVSAQAWPLINCLRSLKILWLFGFSVERTADRCKRLLRRCACGEVNRIIISDEVLFTIQDELKAQNDGVYVGTIEDIPQQIGAAQRFPKLGFIMICETVTLSTGYCQIWWKSQCYVKPEGNSGALPERWGQTCLRSAPMDISTELNPVLQSKNHPVVVSSLHSGF